MSRLIPAPLLVLVFAVLASIALPLRQARAAPSLVGLSQSCVAGKVSATLSWQGTDTSGKEQWVDYSFLDNSWTAGTFQNAGPLSPSANTYTITGLPPTTAHVARINQKLVDDSWQSSPTLPFSTIACAATEGAGPAAGSTTPTAGGNSASATTATPSPSPTPSPTATATPQPTVFQVIGFADHTSSGGPPPDLVPPGGTVQSCGAPQVYGFVRFTNVRSRTELFVSWVLGQSAIPRANLVLAPGSGIAIVDFPIQDHTKASYTLQLQLDKDKPPVAAGEFTLGC